MITALARVQAEAGLIPVRAAELIAEHARADRIDLAFAAEQTRQASHSMLGLIRALQAVLPEQARDYVYAGATVQDITDTWTALALRRIGGLVWRDLRRIEERLLALAAEHRDTVMAGRTHGQPGSPVTFGWKAASWADEIRRHLDRLRDGAPRWLVGQLGGGTGSLVFYGDQGLAVRARFCAALGLADPGISWLTARDRGAEFAQLLALICGTLARIGGEVYELQRPEIGELREAAPDGTVGSITMPHKRNPEGSEHLDTLARLARSSAAVMTEAVVQQHERDGRGWKAEWVAWPETCLLATAALQVAVGLTAGLTVDAAAMRANLARYGGYPVSERALALLTPRLGARRAQDALQQALGQGAAAGLTAEQALARSALFSRGRGQGADRGAGPRLLPADDRPGDRAGHRRPRRRARGVAVIPTASVEALAGALPRTPLAVLPTPLVAAPRLAAALGTGPLLVKRDDLTGFAFGGNKARLLEFLVAAAIADGAGTLLTGGAAGSNFCAATAAAARRAGLACELVIAGARPRSRRGPRWRWPGPGARPSAGPGCRTGTAWTPRCPRRRASSPRRAAAPT